MFIISNYKKEIYVNLEDDCNEPINIENTINMENTEEEPTKDLENIDDFDDQIKLDKKDFLAITIALFQIMIPFAIAIIVIYFIIMLFITGFWLK